MKIDRQACHMHCTAYAAMARGSVVSKPVSPVRVTAQAVYRHFRSNTVTDCVWRYVRASTSMKMAHTGYCSRSFNRLTEDWQRWIF